MQPLRFPLLLCGLLCLLGCTNQQGSSDMQRPAKDRPSKDNSVISSSNDETMVKASDTVPGATKESSKTLDFEKAFMEVGFSLTGDDNGPSGENGIPDYVEMSLIGVVLKKQLSLGLGADEETIRAAWEQAHASATKDIAKHLPKWPHLATLVAGYAMVGTKESFDAINKLSISFGTPLEGDYSLAMGLGKVFGPEGDADGDGFTNRQEFSAFGVRSRDDYLSAALDKAIVPNAEQLNQVSEPKKTRYSIGVILYEGFEALDVYGPVEMWGNVSEFDLFTVAESKGPVRSAQGLETNATYSFEDAPRIDILLVPGGFGTLTQLNNSKILEFLQKRHAETVWTTSVCTGSALLAKAGILDGLRATSNKVFFSIAKDQSDKVQWVEAARWVEDGKVFTSSGVSAGTDMSLALVGKIFGIEKARLLAKQLEYQWHEDKDVDPFAKITQAE